MGFRRYYFPNTTVFITQVVKDRKPVFKQESNVVLLRATLRRVQSIHPFKMVGYVILPDHLHILIHPTGSSNFSQIMHSFKANVTKNYKQAHALTGSLNLWQPRFYDHLIRDDGDFQRHLDYIHYNPVKHGWVAKPEAWPNTSFLTWQSRGVYPEGWGWLPPGSVEGMNLE